MILRKAERSYKESITKLVPFKLKIRELFSSVLFEIGEKYPTKFNGLFDELFYQFYSFESWYKYDKFNQLGLSINHGLPNDKSREEYPSMCNSKYDVSHYLKAESSFLINWEEDFHITSFSEGDEEFIYQICLTVEEQYVKRVYLFYNILDEDFNRLLLHLKKVNERK
ncbi:hypothetical protein Q4Q35_19575 [Flavivirga aquimarina]|uniref:Uncharacterized protein n=1 Tax=Flavivirga aquimarina TaxID=2027862 RepID=A0ABT8WFZ9_9FLAO|nr:hypothetical protein [Flavivirga aquimarina]MDO5972007.1 hypothetical protein [Flavivirga aquimarina]